ncbi:hypothetical protein [Colwellia sp. PAMC 21821]|uniref:hypothetical protein n=1 Tax=Colwellia sp. PAMC 21821 TaxID=1816219 RepID=UPI0009BDFF43|nr:hypothetical protein [Colwellia sp. PAMC 21821]ARD43808.1 hypothetical protein A3Q33_05475 [Colwellia sp. PAMC 21821]
MSDMMREVRESIGSKRRGKGKKPLPEFPTVVLKNMKLIFIFLQELIKESISKLPVYYSYKGEKKEIIFQNIDELIALVLVKIKGEKSVYINILEFEKLIPGHYLIRVSYMCKRNEPRRNLTMTLQPTICAVMHRGKVIHYWLIKANNADDALRIQNIIANKSGGNSRCKRPERLRLPDAIYFKNKELLSRGIETTMKRPYTTKWLDIGCTHIAENIAIALNVDFIPAPTKIELEGITPTPLTRKEMPASINQFSVDLKYNKFGNKDALYIATVCATSSIINNKVVIETSDSDIGKENILLDAVISGCLVGRSNDGSAESLELVVKTLHALQEKAEIAAKSKKQKYRIEDKFHSKMEDSLMSVAVKKAISIAENGSGVAHEVKNSLLEKVLVHADGAPELCFSKPVYHTNDIDFVLKEIPNIEHGTVIFPVNTARMLRKAASDEGVEQELSNLINRTNYTNVSFLSMLSINEFDDIREESEVSTTTYLAPIESYDIYICSTDESLKFRNNAMVQEESVKALSEQFVALSDYIMGLDAKTPVVVKLSKAASDIHDELNFDIGQLIKSAPVEPWVHQQLESLDSLAYKLALNIAFMDAYDEYEKQIEPVDEISKFVMVKAVALTNFIGQNILKLAFNEHIDYVNALSIAPKLRLITTEFTVRTLYKDKGWAGIKNNPIRTKGALNVLAKFGWVVVVKIIEKDEEDIMVYRSNPALLTNSAEPLAPVAPSELKLNTVVG